MDNRFMKRAIELAIENVQVRGGGPFGAVIVRDGKIVGEGANQVTLINDPTAHAEVVAIRNTTARLKNFRLSGCEIYTSCEPCPMCLGAIYWSHLEAVHFATTADDATAAGFDDSEFYRQVQLPWQKRSIRTEQIMREAGLAAFRAWVAKPDKVPY